MIKKLYLELDKKIRLRLQLSFLFSIITIVLESLSIISVFPIIKTVLDPNFFRSEFTIIDLTYLNDGLVLIMLFAFVFFLFLFKNVALYYVTIFNSKFITFATANLTGKFFKNYLDLEYKEFIKHNSSYYIRNVIENINGLFSIYFRSIITLFTETFVVTILIFILYKLYPLGTTIFLVTFTFLGAILYFINKNVLKKYGQDINDYFHKRLINLNHAFSSYQEINITNTNNYFTRIFNKNLRDLAVTAYKIEGIVQIPRLVLEVVGISMILVFLYFLNQDKSLSFNDYLPSLSLFAISGLRMLPSATRIVSSFNRIKYSSAAIETLSKEVDRFHKNKREELKQVSETIHFKSLIEIKNLDFSYDDKKKIFDNLNIEFKKREFNVIYGPSGCGKTTLMNILLGFLKPDKGSIIVDGKSILYHLNGWRSLMSFVPQEINLADNDLISNLAYGVNESEIDFKKIDKVLDMVDLKDFVNSLPNKLKTYTGEKGFKISGGQRQRIAIARALYRDKEILILDEATSALDQETEKKIIKNIKENMKEKIVIFISHRDSVRKYADKIFQFRNKEIFPSN
jgi:ABC-type multidrug transport system fused ATPase/permease subunit